MSQPTPQSTPTPTPPLLTAPTVHLPQPRSMTVPLVDIEVTDANGAVNETVKNMSIIGQTDPIVLEEHPGQTYLIHDGKRRVINARKLEWTTMRAEVYPPLTREQRAHLKLSLHRRAPNMVDESRALADLARVHGINPAARDAAEQLARVSGMKVAQVRRYLKLVNLPADIVELIGTTVSEGVATNVASLQGTHRDDAIARIRAAAATDDGRFTGQDLKDVQLARTEEMAGALTGGQGGVFPPIFTLSPVQALASDVRILCTERHIDLADLITELQSGAAPAVVNPFEAAFGAVQAVPTAAAPGSAPPAPVLTADATPWEMPTSPAPVEDDPVPEAVDAAPALDAVTPEGEAVTDTPAWDAAPLEGPAAQEAEALQGEAFTPGDLAETTPDLPADEPAAAADVLRGTAGLATEAPRPVEEVDEGAALAASFGGGLDLNALFGMSGSDVAAEAAAPEVDAAVTPDAPAPVTPDAPVPFTPAAPATFTPQAPAPFTPGAPAALTPAAPRPFTPGAAPTPRTSVR